MTTPNIFAQLATEVELDDAPVQKARRRSQTTDLNGLPIVPLGLDKETGIMHAPVDVRAMAMSLLLNNSEPVLVLAGEWLTQPERTQVEQKNALAMGAAAGLQRNGPFGTWLTYRSAFNSNAADFADLQVLQLNDRSALGFRPDDGDGIVVSIYRKVTDVIKGSYDTPAQPPVWSIHLPDCTLQHFGALVSHYIDAEVEPDLKASVRGKWMR